MYYTLAALEQNVANIKSSTPKRAAWIETGVP